MIFDVPVAFKAYGKVNGARVSSSVGFVEVIPFDIPAIDGDAAPIVAEWDDAAPEYVGVQEVPFVGMEHVRIQAGKYWRPARAYEIASGLPDHLAMVDVRDFSRSLAKSAVIGLEKQQNPNASKNRVPAAHFANLDRTSKDFSVRAVGKYLSRFRVIDGLVYEQCGQPVVLLSEVRFEAAIGDDVFRRNRITNPNYKHWRNNLLRVMTMDRVPSLIHPDLLFTLGNFKDALKRVRRMNISATIEKDAINAFNEARRPRLGEGYMVDEYNARAEECGMYLRYFVARLEANQAELLPAGDHQRLRLFCDLAAAIDLLPEPEGFDVVESAGREYLERYEEYYTHTHPEQQALKKAIVLAENRPVFVDVFSSPSVDRGL
jgi:hypothetical protein